MWSHCVLSVWLHFTPVRARLKGVMGEFKFRHKTAGYTLMETLIVVSIIVLLALLLLINIKTQLARGRDAKRKADLQKIQKAFEEYNNDNSCYPAASILTNCGSSDLSPYIPHVPCDPTSKQPYLYVMGSPDSCLGYHVCARLENTQDPDIARIGCDPYNGCGFGVGYNYCVSYGASVTATGFVPGAATATPTPTPQYSGNYACTPGGACNLYDDPPAHGCPVSYAVNNCNNQCSNPANRCMD